MQQGTRPKTMKIFYFAWLKEHTGCSFEDMHLPEGVETVGALIPHITRKSAGHETALANLEAVGQGAMPIRAAKCKANRAPVA